MILNLTTPNLGVPSAGDLSNCTGTPSGLTAGAAQGLTSATTTVVVSAATAPTAGQVLTATSSTAADWETPSAIGSANPSVYVGLSAVNGTALTFMTS